MLEFHDVAQNTPEWLQMRSGKLTSSKLGTIMANYGGAFGQPAKDYAVNIAIEQITGEYIPSTYSDAHMKRGHEQEPIARMMYEDERFCDVTNGGLFSSDFLGCSPDGLVYANGLIEIKAVVGHVQYANIKRNNIQPAYKWQCSGHLMFSDREWLDFVSYCSVFPEGNQLFVFRLNAEDLKEDFLKLKSRIDQFEDLVYKTKKTIEANNGYR